MLIISVMILASGNMYSTDNIVTLKYKKNYLLQVGTLQSDKKSSSECPYMKSCLHLVFDTAFSIVYKIFLVSDTILC